MAQVVPVALAAVVVVKAGDLTVARMDRLCVFTIIGGR